MFLGLPFHAQSSLQRTVLILNTVLFIVVLIGIEFVYSETDKRKRRELRYFFPLILVLAGLLLYAAYTQTVGSA